MISETAGGVKIRLYVQPQASKNQIIGPHNGALKVKIQAPPVEGKANDEIIFFFSKLLKIPKSHLEISKGDLSRHKTLLILGVSKEQFEKMLEQQT